MDTRRPAANLGLTAAVCVVFVAGMVGMSFAAAPLYRIFCQVTGYGGTTQRAERAPAATLDRVVTVRFDANVGNGLGWSFRPLVREVKVKLGEVGDMKPVDLFSATLPTAGGGPLAASARNTVLVTELNARLYILRLPSQRGDLVESGRNTPM